MKDKKVDYIAIYGMADSPESPSAIARFIQCKDPLSINMKCVILLIPGSNQIMFLNILKV